MHLNLRCLLVMWCLAPLFAQSQPEYMSCTALAAMPVRIPDEQPLLRRRRFELRECGDGKIVVNGYRENEVKPSLTVDTGDPYPIFLAQVADLLVLQSAGGAFDHVYVFSFEKGRPVLALKTATKDLIQVRQSGDNIVLSVPLTTYPRTDGKLPKAVAPKRFTFRINR